MAVSEEGNDAVYGKEGLCRILALAMGSSPAGKVGDVCFVPDTGRHVC
jgi:hypothetical protein